MGAKPLRLLMACFALITITACSSSGGTLPVPTQLTSFEPQVQFDKGWSVSVGDGFASDVGVMLPVLVDNVIYAASGSQLSAVNAQTSEKSWSLDLNSPITAGVGAFEGQLFVGSKSGKLFAVSQDDGALMWQVNASSQALVAPQANSNIVVLQTIDGKVSAYSTADGSFQWSYAVNLPSLTLRGTSTPFVNEAYTYAGFANGKIVAIDNQTGGVVWQKAISLPKGRSEIERLVDIDGAVNLVDGLLYVTGYQGNLVAMDALTGSVVWQQPVSSAASALMLGKAVIVIDESGVILAYDAKQGYVLWQNETLKYRGLSAPMELDSKVLVLDASGHAHLLNLDDGAIIGRKKLGISGPQVGSLGYQDAIFLLSLDGDLIRLGLK